jgi:hypothetical protein
MWDQRIGGRPLVSVAGLSRKAASVVRHARLRDVVLAREPSVERSKVCNHHSAVEHSALTSPLCVGTLLWEVSA